jgi:hypothetical protein
MKIATLMLAAAALVTVTPATAATYAIHYNGTSGTPLPTTADFRITTASHLDALGGYDVLSASGNVNGVAISGLAPANPPGFQTDNTFFTAGPAFDMFGLGWLAGSTTGNLYFQDGVFTLAQFDPALPKRQRYITETSGDVTVAAVPEPASWALLVAGFAVVGAASRRQRTVVAA